jgi:tetratricopeptide (TPR) repeat protein
VAEQRSPERGWPARYRPVRHVGRGAFGDVFEAEDTIRRERVAIKQLPLRADADRDHLRRETVAMRLARLPGVVRLRDDFEVQGHACLVMDLVPGVWFGQGRPPRWEAIEVTVHALLATLVRLHLQGLVHQDLKPANVLVDGDRVVVLDLGMARGQAMRWFSRRAAREGTLLYAAPEQLRGEDVSEVADVYAVGMMVRELLTGQTPRTRDTIAGLLQSVEGPERPRSPIPDAAAPRSVVELVDAMVALRPADRPDARAALEWLGGAPPILPWAAVEALPERAAAGALQRLFRGPDWYTHLQEDAAACLLRRTGGERTRVVEELSAWVQSGLAVCTDAGVAVSREALRRLEAGEAVRVGRAPTVGGEAARTLRAARVLFPHSTPEAVGRISGVAEPARVLATLVERGLAWWLEDGSVGVDLVGDPVDAWMERAALDVLPPGSERRKLLLVRLGELDGLVARSTEERGLAELFFGHARRIGEPALEAQALRQLAAEAILEGTPDALDRARRLVDVSGAQGLEAVVDLLRTAALRTSGDPEAALALWRGVPAQAHVGLEAVRLRLGSVLLTRLDLPAAEGWLAGWGAEALAEPMLEETRLHAWGNLRYAQRRYDEAASLFLRMARADRVAGLTNMIAALVDAGRLEEAEQLGREALRVARALRDSGREALLHYLLRAASYRAGHAVEVDEARTEALLLESPLAGGYHALVDAAIAWRAGAAGPALRCARRLWAAASVSAERPIGVLAAALVSAAGEIPEGGLEAVAARAAALQEPAVEVQALALLCGAGLGEGWGARLLERAARVDRARWQERREVMSVAEAVAFGER